MIGSLIYLCGASLYGYGASGELQSWATVSNAGANRSPSSTTRDYSETTAFIHSQDYDDDDNED